MSSKAALAPATLIAPPTVGRALPWATSASIFATDFLTLSLVYWVSVIARYSIGHEYHLGFYFALFPSLLFICGLFLSQGLYPGLLLHPAEELRRIHSSISLFFLLFMAGSFLWRNAEVYSRSVMLVTWALSVPGIFISRHYMRRIFCKQDWWGIHAVVFGSGDTAQRVVRFLSSRHVGVKVSGVFTEELDTWSQDLPPVFGPIPFAAELPQDLSSHYAIVAMSQRNGSQLVHDIQDYCRGFGHILLVPDLPGICSMGIVAKEVGGELGFEVPQRLFHRSSALTKRLLDLLVSSLALVLLSPLFIAVAILIKITSRGPVFFGHSRFGRAGKTFSAIKFRTMVTNGDEVLLSYFQANPREHEEWLSEHKLRNDPRITRIGKWLRRYSIDEIPQLLNVVAGQMSLVGPRPIVAAEIPKYGRGYSLYKRVLPGITGLWQVSGRNNTTYPQRVSFDEYYVHNWSVWLDAYLLLRTIKTVVTAEGAY